MTILPAAKWILVFLLAGNPERPAASGPWELETCLEMARTQREVWGTKNPYCYNYRTKEWRKP